MTFILLVLRPALRVVLLSNEHTWVVVVRLNDVSHHVVAVTLDPECLCHVGLDHSLVPHVVGVGEPWTGVATYQTHQGCGSRKSKGLK